MQRIKRKRIGGEDGRGGQVIARQLSGGDESSRSLTRHGSNNDITINDITLYWPGVSWQRDSVPADLPGEDEAIKKRMKRVKSGKNGIESLRQIAARTLAIHSRDINKMLLRNRNISWDTGWKLVWSWICDLRLDSYPLFTIFMNEFGHGKDFHCHHRQTCPISKDIGYPETKRDLFLDSRLLPSITTKHRIEYIPYGGVSGVSSMLETINRFNYDIGSNIVLVDLSGLKIPSHLLSDVCLNLTNLKKLSGLDVSGCGVVENSNILTLWRLAMTSGEWKNSLKILCLGDSHYLDEVTTSVYKSLFDTPLVYIEGPSRYSPNERDWIHGRNVRGISSRFTNHYSLAFKYHFLSTSDGENRVKLTRARIMQEFIMSRNEDSNCWTQRVSLNCKDCYVRKEMGKLGERVVRGDKKLTIRKSKVRGMVLDRSGSLI